MSDLRYKKQNQTRKICILLLIFAMLLLLVPTQTEAANCSDCGYDHSATTNQIGLVCPKCKNYMLSNKSRIASEICDRCGFDKYEDYDDPTTDPIVAVTSIRCTLCGHAHDYEAIENSLVGGGAYNIALTAYSGVIGFGQSPITIAEEGKFSITSLLLMDRTLYATMYSAAEQIYNALAIVGYMLIFIYFLLEIGEVQLNDGFTYETLAKHAIKSLIACMIINCGPTLIEFAITAAGAAMEPLARAPDYATSAPFTYNSCPVNNILDSWLHLGAIAVFFDCAIPYIFILVCYGSTFILLWTRALDIVIRIMFAPIGMADTIHGGMSSSGVRYFKKFVASLFQGACMMATIIAYNEIRQSISGSLTGFLGTILVALATLTALKQTSGIASDAIGTSF